MIKKVISMSLESWNTVLQFASAVLLGLTFMVGAGAIFTSYVIVKHQEERIAIAGRDAANALERAAELNRKTEEERLARVKIEERLAPRMQVVSPEQQARIVAKLAAFKGYRADIGAFPFTFEGEMLARQIQTLLVAASWSAEMMQAEATGPLSVVGSGVMVRATSDSRSLAAATALVEALIAEKVHASVVLGLPGPTKEASQDDPYIFRVLIIVGDRP